MTDASQPRVARRATLPAGCMAAALFALLAFAPIASAAPDPLASGNTTVTLKQGFVKSLKNKGVAIRKISPAKLKGTKATFPVRSGTLDPLTGAGNVAHNGGLKFKAGKRSAAVKALEINTSKKSLTAKVAGKKMKLATASGLSHTRNGFGVNLTIKKLKLTASAAKRLNKKLGYSSKGKASPFKGGLLIGSARSETQPATVTVLPGGNVTFTADTTTLAKLVKVQVKVEAIPPTISLAPGLYQFPISGGTISPAGTAGVVQSSGGLKLIQDLEPEPGKKLTTTITLGAFFVDLSARTATVEAVTESNASPELNQGPLGRTSVADLSVASVVADPTTRTVGVSASSTLQPIAAKVLNAFVEVYKAAEPSPLIPDVSPEPINSGDPLGTFSFTAQTQ
jgi:hypothetical protein